MPKILMDGNFVRVQREPYGLGDEEVVTITTKTIDGWEHREPYVILSQDEWNDVRQAAANDGPRRAYS